MKRRRERHAIYLVPGFFGFANLGRLRYFVHVDRFLSERCAERGIDARLAVAPGVRLPTDVDVEHVASRVRSVVGVSAAHHGTPLAAALATRRGQQ